MVRLTTCPHYFALRPYLRAFGGVVGLLIVGLVSYNSSSLPQAHAARSTHADSKASL